MQGSSTLLGIYWNRIFLYILSVSTIKKITMLRKQHLIEHNRYCIQAYCSHPFVRFTKRLSALQKSQWKWNLNKRLTLWQWGFNYIQVSVTSCDVSGQFSKTKQYKKILKQSHSLAAKILIWESAFDLICSWQRMKVWLWWQSDTIAITC